MYVFRDQYLRSGKVFRTSLERTDFPSLGNHWLTVTLHVGVGLSEISHIHIGMLTGGVALQAFYSQPSDSSFKHTGPNLCLEDSISHQISGSCGS